MGNDNKLSGKSLDVTMLNLALYGELDPDVPRMSPKELKEAYEYLGSFFTAPKELVGSVVITSTAGETKRGEYFKKLWDNGSE